jgi:thioredoxin reductase (NADPH)
MTPILLAVHEQTRELEIIQRELVSRYDADYEIVCEQSVESALERLDVLRAAGAQVLVLFAADEMTAMTGIEYLQLAHELHPRAQRVLLIPQGPGVLSKCTRCPVRLTRRSGSLTWPTRVASRS